MKPRTAGSIGGKNIFGGLCKCMECGTAMVVRTGRHPGLRYMRCKDFSVGKACKTGKQYALHRLEPVLLDEIELFLARQVQEDVRQGVDVNQQIAAVQVELEKEARHLKRLLLNFDDETDPVFLDAISVQKAEVAGLRKSLADLDQKRMQESVTPKLSDQVAVIRDLRNLIVHGSPVQVEDARARLGVAVRRVVDQVSFSGNGVAIMTIKSGAVHISFHDNQWAWTRTTFGSRHFYSRAGGPRPGQMQDLPEREATLIAAAIDKATKHKRWVRTPHTTS